MKTICVVLVSLAAAYAAKIETVFKFEQVEEIRVKDDSDGVHWAVIVAGSNGWYNYRHQVKIKKKERARGGEREKENTYYYEEEHLIQNIFLDYG